MRSKRSWASGPTYTASRSPSLKIWSDSTAKKLRSAAPYTGRVSVGQLLLLFNKINERLERLNENNYFSVTGAYKEPLPGWVGNNNGPAYIFVGVGLGAVHTCYYKGDPMDLVPVDYSINSILAAAYDIPQRWFVYCLFSIV